MSRCHLGYDWCGKDADHDGPCDASGWVEAQSRRRRRRHHLRWAIFGALLIGWHWSAFAENLDPDD